MRALVGTTVDCTGIRADVAVIWEDSTIVDVVPRERLGDYDVDEIYGGKGYLVLPGFINSHTHVAMAKFRGVGEDLPTPQWLSEVIWPAEREWTPREIHRWALLGMAEVLSNGSTTINDHYFFAGEIAKVAEKLGVRAFVGQTVMDLVDFPLAAPEEGFRFFKRWDGKDSLVTPTLAPHATNTVSLELMQELGELAREKSVPIHVHLAQSRAEVLEVKRRYGTTPVRYLERAGVLGKSLLGVHGVYLEDGDVWRFGRSGATLVHCPVSNVRLEARVPQVLKFENAGANVALGNDSPNPVGLMDMFQEMRMVSLAYGITVGPSGRVGARKVFEWATVGGARALGIRAGLIKSGYLADLILVNGRKPQFLPGENIYSHVVYSTRGSDVEMVFVDGEMVYRNGVLPKLGKTLEDLWEELGGAYPLNLTEPPSPPSLSR
ncbi:amidohydrolase [Thermococcus sp.]|uniref:amidohydrolase family protein n=1 Tax=Thermococcus sp. TaxID=35749 RepID=UPI002607BB27|nr:amidohydrolase [Thermococcus sp.]